MTDQVITVTESADPAEVRWTNGSGETVPAWGVVEVTDYDTATGIYTIGKPSTAGNLWFANGHKPVDDGDEGESNYFSTPQRCLIDYDNVFPGSGLSPKPDTWTMAGGSRFVLITNDDDEAGSGIGAVIEAPQSGRYSGVIVTAVDPATEALSSPSTCCFRVLEKDFATGNLKTTSTVLTVVNRYEGISIAAGTYARAEFLDYEWSLYGADCINTSISTSSEGCEPETSGG